MNKSESKWSNSTGWFGLISFQILLCVIFALFSDYDERLLPIDKNSTVINSENNTKDIIRYPLFQDIHVMIFVGFAFLMTFLKRFGYSATGYNLLLGSMLLQWAIIIRGCFELEHGKITLSIDSLIGADIAIAAILISMGATLGRATPIQLLIMGVIEIVVFAANEYFQLEYLKIADAGGSVVVHAFGAYFGLAVSFILRPKKGEEVVGQHEGPTYTSDLFAMLGSLFLWIFWPSFNSILCDGSDQQRVIVNTYLSLGAATVTTFALCALLTHEKKLDMVFIQNATLAGGVTVGAACNMIIRPHGAILIGICGAIISVLGYRYLTPLLNSKLRLIDTCGVHNLHGMPAVLAAFFAAYYAATASLGVYKDSLYTVFPGITQITKSLDVANTNSSMSYNTTASSQMFTVDESPALMLSRSPEVQAGYQLLGIFSTLGIAIGSGIFTGLVMRAPSVKRLTTDQIHDDKEYWEVPE